MDNNKTDNKGQSVLSAQHLQILDYLESLFSRQSLRKNLYLSPKMSSPLQIPLFVVAEERKIAQITHDQTVLIEALEMCDLVHVLHEKRLIEIIQYPTVKVEKKNAHLLKEFEEFFKNYTQKQQLKLKYQFAKQPTQDGFFYITIRDLDDPTILQSIIHIFNQKMPQPLLYSKQGLYEDIKEGIQKQKKLKKQSLSKIQHSKDVISPDRPQPIFIRKAIESSEDEEEQVKKVIKKEEKKGKGKKMNGQKTYKESKSIINDKDFPSLG